MEDKIPFSIDEPEFDQNSFGGRFRTYLRVSNQFHAFYSKDMIRKMEKAIDV